MKFPGTTQVVVVSIALAMTFSGVPAASASSFGDASSPEFVSSQITDQRGDVVRIPVRLSGSSSASIEITGQNIDYDAELTLEDRNHDGRVVVEFNTYLAGEKPAFRAADQGDRVSARSQTEVDGTIPTGRYRLILGDSGETMELELQRRSADGLTTMVAPEGAFTRLASADAIDQYRTDGNLTARNADDTAAVASGDTMAVAIDASGLSGALADQPGANDTERFRALAESDVLSFTVEQANPDTGQQRAHLLLNRGGVSVVSDVRGDRYYVLVDTTAAHYQRGEDGTVESGLPDGARFDTNLTVDADSTLGVDSPRSAETAFEIVDRSATLRTHAEAGQYFLLAESDQFVEGVTSIAPGSTVEVQVEAPDGAFDVTKSVTVGQSNGSGILETSVDLAGISENTTLSATASDHRGSLTVDPAAVTVQSPEAALQEPSLSVEGSTLYATVSADLSRGGLIAVRADNESGRLLGAAAVDPDSDTVEIPLENLPEKGTPLILLPVRDIDSDGAVSASVDVPYTQSNSPRLVKSTVALYKLPPSPTPTPTPGGDDTVTPSSPDATQSSDDPTTGDTPGTTQDDSSLPVDVPGFGPAVALAALLAAFLLFARRE